MFLLSGTISCYPVIPNKILPLNAFLVNSTSPTRYRVEIDPDFFWFRLTAIVECIVLGEVCQIKVLGSGILPSSQVLLITNEGDRA